MLCLGATGIDHTPMHYSRKSSMTSKRLIATAAILLGATTAALAQGMGATSAPKKPYPTAEDYAASHRHIPVKWHKHHHHSPVVQSPHGVTGSAPQH
jgi:hypothetical protein